MVEILKLLNRIDEQLYDPAFIAEVMEEALKAVDPYQAVKRSMWLDHSQLCFQSNSYQLLPDTRIYLLAIGKAAELMSLAALEILGDWVNSGLCVPKYPAGLLEGFPQMITIKGDHPVPGKGSLAAGREIQRLLDGLVPSDIVLVLLSGGGSALASLPAENITLTEIQQMTDVLLKAGHSISEINSIRKHLDLLKGGGILKMAQPAKVVSLILSDVIGDPLDVIASGPTVPDSSTFQQAFEVLQRTKYSPSLIPNIVHRLKMGEAGLISETYKGIEPGIRPAHNLLIGSNKIACQAAKEKASSFGIFAEVVTTQLNGEARDAGKFLAAYAKEYKGKAQNGVFIFGGETTVTVRGKGVGGRNLETALAAVEGLAGLDKWVLVTLATDGDDGTSQAAGAVVTGSTAARALMQGLDPVNYLQNNDSFHFFKALRNVLITGPTGTNVNDIAFLFRF